MHAWLPRFQGLCACVERRADIDEAFLESGCCVICRNTPHLAACSEAWTRKSCIERESISVINFQRDALAFVHCLVQWQPLGLQKVFRSQESGAAEGGQKVLV
ncbi:hypothetical protein [Burkholderia sp. F1]|uniref:hypothetical protein n=1 Tax=Burkholderia sp. F1 TaxID=3366817 RepID=UPI003D72F7A9